MEEKMYDLELTIAKVLRYGVLLAGFVILVGWTMQIHGAEDPFAAFQKYTEHPLKEELRTLIWNRNWGLLTCYFGLTLLILLPFARVLMTAILFLRQREYIMATIAAIVMAGLLLSISLGFQI